MNNSKLIEKFYASFVSGNASEMTSCYHDDIVFKDPVFGTLKGSRAKKMWEMLLSRRTDTTKVTFENVQSTSDKGTANWQAEYLYGKANRKVINKISAEFKFQDGKIIEHIDTFDLYKWTQQAMGPVGYLLGWTPFIKNKIQKTVNKQLDDYIA